MAKSCKRASLEPHQVLDAAHDRLGLDRLVLHAQYAIGPPPRRPRAERSLLSCRFGLFWMTRLAAPRIWLVER